ncbi:hypothetical protein [Streptomyces marianii]|uniref:hypothetical protein n=1 Tax=Streptomyces marianii TaxID=1817406 RepID=UPI001F35D105|nr:hypothetical protein [Streptomyces marianii]
MRPTDEAFSLRGAVSAVDDLLTGPVPVDGPTHREADDDTGWTGGHGAGFRLVPLWQSRSHFDVPGSEWDAAQEESRASLASLAEEKSRSFRSSPDHRTRPLR